MSFTSNRKVGIGIVLALLATLAILLSNGTVTSPSLAGTTVDMVGGQESIICGVTIKLTYVLCSQEEILRDKTIKLIEKEIALYGGIEFLARGLAQQAANERANALLSRMDAREQALAELEAQADAMRQAADLSMNGTVVNGSIQVSGSTTALYNKAKALQDTNNQNLETLKGNIEIIERNLNASKNANAPVPSSQLNQILAQLRPLRPIPYP